MNTTLTRRALFGGATALAASALLPTEAFALGSECRLALRNVHTRETCDAVFARGGAFLHSGLAELNHSLRDWRNGQATAMDPRLMMLLADLRDRLDLSPQTRINIISGYRSPATNARLHAHSSAVASSSQHILGKALDIAIPGVPLARLHNAALDMRRGGVGYYPKDGFVHIDTGPVRHWT